MLLDKTTHLIFQNTDLVSEQKKNMNSDLNNILEWTKKLTPSTLNKTLSGQPTTSSQPWLKLSTEECSERRALFNNHKRLFTLTLKTYLLQSTGEQKVQSMLFKTKDNADHAGLSHQLQQWKELISLKLELFSSFLNNNLLIAIHNQVDVTEVLKPGLSNT